MKQVAIRSLCVIALVVGVAAAASAQGRPCSSVNGEWAYTKTGTLLLPTGPVPYAAVGKLMIAPGGTIAGSQDSSTGGMVARNVLNGTIEIDEDCSATATVQVYDAAGTILQRTAVMRLIADDNTGEFRAIVTQLTLGNGVIVPQVMTAAGRRVLNNLGR